MREPGAIEIVLILALRRLMRGFYEQQIERLPLQGNERVLDFGCGSGETTRLMARRLPAGRVVGVDLSQKWVDVARRRVRDVANVELCAGDIRRLGIPDSSQDAMLVSFVIHHIDPPDRRDVVAAALRTLAPHGWVYVFEAVREISPAQVDGLMAAAGLRRGLTHTGRAPLIGPTWEALYTRPD